MVSHAFGITRSVAREKILRGLVRLDGKRVDKPSSQVDAGIQNKLELINHNTGNRDTTTWKTHDHVLFYKPRGCITAQWSNKHKTVIEVLQQTPYFKPRLRPVGRLDLDTTGLLLFTTDGELLHRLTHPDWHVPKRYDVETMHPVTEPMIARLRQGVELKDPRTGKFRLAAASDLKPISDTRMEMTIGQGMYRQIRRMFASQGTEVVELKRISMGPLELPDELRIGEAMPLSEDLVQTTYACVSL
eukprot:CAMPEP_0170169374 /NCGR_PEP_ID=MMETSP0040_2-20121228/2294_1 /TAXON_ID=641309 /ORGANISM="Lotharella oceanica, Strain CCMP622" /LENGTH=244 /DNA_ID=CAMNT_0010408085 /DNA_START=27 /DNA_END=761 /DNA_ORIENTATION=+